MRKKTHTNPLSRREIELLRNNPHIASVTENTVRFTEEFKKLAYEQKAKGVPVAETMRRCGIDPEILGASRVLHSTKDCKPCPFLFTRICATYCTLPGNRRRKIAYS